MALTPSQWDRRVELTALTPPATLSGFVAYLNEDSLPAEIWTTALNGGGDIRVCTDKDGVNQLPLQVVSFDTVGEAAQLWFRFSTLSTAARKVWVFYGKAAETQPPVAGLFGRNAVWADYTHRLGGDGQTDVTGATTTTLVGDVSQSGSVAGFNAINTAGEPDSYLRFNGTDGENWTGDFTVSAWVNSRSTAVAFANIIGIRATSAWEFSYRIESDKPSVLIGTSSPESTSAITIDQDHLLTATVSGTLISYYIDGALTDTKTVVGVRTNRTISITVNGYNNAPTGRVLIGRTANACGINGSVRTADHISAEWDNQSNPSAYWTTGTPENTSTTTTITVIMNHLKNQGIA